MKIVYLIIVKLSRTKPFNINYLSARKHETFTNVLVSSKPDPHRRATPGNSHVLSVPGVGFSPNYLCLEGGGFELEIFPTVFREKCKNFSNCFREARGSLQSRCSCAVSYKGYVRFVGISLVFLFMKSKGANFP